MISLLENVPIPKNEGDVIPAYTSVKGRIAFATRYNKVNYYVWVNDGYPPNVNILNCGINHSAKYISQDTKNKVIAQVENHFGVSHISIFTINKTIENKAIENKLIIKYCYIKENRQRSHREYNIAVHITNSSKYQKSVNAYEMRDEIYCELDGPQLSGAFLDGDRKANGDAIKRLKLETEGEGADRFIFLNQNNREICLKYIKEFNLAK